MTKSDLTLIFESADNKQFEVPAYPNENLECLGIALWTGEKHPVTLVGAVSLVRWQAVTMLGTWDGEMLQETLIFLRDKAVLISSKSPTIPTLDLNNLDRTTL